MSYIGINFSARNSGNCNRIGEYINEQIAKKMQLFHVSDFTISPCGPCEYECAAGNLCPIQDELMELTERLHQAEQIYFFLPTYNGHFPSTYYIFMERMSPVFHEDEVMEGFLRKLSILYIGNDGCGAEGLIKELKAMYEEYKLKPRVLQISSKEYAKKAIRDNLLEVSDVRKLIQLFAGE